MEQLPPLSCAPRAPIRILQITDLHHFGPAATATSFTGPRVTVPIGAFEPGQELEPEQSPGGYSVGRGIALIRRLLQQVDPTLVVFSGDIIDGRMCTDHVAAMAEVVAPCVEHGVKWCFTPGNHDDDPPCGWSRADLMDVFRLPGCATPAATSFNHTLTLGGVVRLFFFDSHGSAKTSRDGVTPQAVRAYEALSRSPAMAGERAAGVVGLSYFHIPLCEYADPASRVAAGRISELRSMRPAGFGGRMVGCPRVNTGLYGAMERQRNVRGVFVGHDHYHDAVLRRRDAGPWLCYGRVGAFSPPADFEGAGGALPFRRGGRVVEIAPIHGAGGGAERAAVSTWIETVHGPEPQSLIRLARPWPRGEGAAAPGLTQGRL